MRWTARALTGPSSDTDTCLSIFFENTPSHKYIFNCGEATFRATQQRKHGLAKIKGVFLTGIGSSTSGGLPGMYMYMYARLTMGTRWLINRSFVHTGLLMSAADSGVRELDIVGPPGLNHFLASTRSYALR